MADESRMSALLDHAQDKLAVVDEAGTYRYANAASDRILGLSPSTLVGRNAFDLIHPDDRDPVRRQFEAVVEGDRETVETAEYRHRSAGDDWVWLESRMADTYLPDLGGYVVSSRDVTAKKRAERRKRRRVARLEDLAANSEDVLWMFTADWSELLFVNDAYEDIWGQRVETLRENPRHFLEGIHRRPGTDARVVPRDPPGRPGDRRGARVGRRPGPP